MHTSLLFKIIHNRHRSANHNRSEILWTDLPDANPWNHNWEEHVFISVSQDGLRWQLSDATEQVRSWPMVFTPFPVHHFTPRAFQEINMRLVSREKRKIYKGKAYPWIFVRWIRNRFFQCWILMMYFDLVVMLNIFFIPTIEFLHSTGDPLLIMPSLMSCQLSFLGCCPVAGEPSEHWIIIWPAEYSLKSAQRFAVPICTELVA
jgi:hypothetical protein